MAGRGSDTQVPDSRERVRTNPLGADLNSRRLARRVHAKDGVHTCAGLAIEENHRKWFSSQGLRNRLFHAVLAPIHEFYLLTGAPTA